MKSCNQGTIIVVALSLILGVFAYGLVFSPMSDKRVEITKDILLLIVGGFLGYLTKHAVEASGEGASAVVVNTKDVPAVPDDKEKI